MAGMCVSDEAFTELQLHVELIHCMHVCLTLCVCANEQDIRCVCYPLSRAGLGDALFLEV